MKKIFISADIEGTCGIVSWNETEKSHSDYAPFAQRMTGEVNAACLGAIAGGAEHILVKDAHDSAANIDAERLPSCASVFRGWGNEPLVMMAGLDKTFDGAFMTGYHSGALMGGNPLAHTMSGKIAHVKINGMIATEMMINAYAAAMLGVPLLLVTGDETLCNAVHEISPHTVTFAVSKGVGAGAIAIHPEAARKGIEAAAKKAMSLDAKHCLIHLPDSFSVEVSYKEHFRARHNSFYPGAALIDAHTIAYQAKEYKDVLAFFHFCL